MEKKCQKYEFTNETKIINIDSSEVTLHRIRATRSFGTVKTGDLGGWIESESNLSHEGNAWVCNEAKVYGNAKVYDNARISGCAKVYGNAHVFGSAEIYNCAKVFGNALIRGHARVWSHAEIYDNAQIDSYATVWCNAQVYGNAKIYDHAQVFDNALVCGNTEVGNYAIVCENAVVFSTKHVLVIGPIGSKDAFTTFYRDQDNKITVKCGCFLGKVDEFLQKVTETHGDNKHASVYRAAAEIAKLQMNLEAE